MNQFMNNRYVQITGLILGLAILIYMLLWMLLALAGIRDVPSFVPVVVSLGVAIWVVWKFYARRIG